MQAEITAASPRGGPTTCKPTGRLSLVNPHGIEAAGQVVRVIIPQIISQSIYRDRWIPATSVGIGPDRQMGALLLLDTIKGRRS